MIYANAFTVWYHTIVAPQGQTLWAGSLWSNMWAWALCGFLGILWAKKELLKLHTKIDKNHIELKDHITKTHKGK
jgi:hypothetical protein